MITTLFTFFVESAKVEKKIDHVRSAVLNRSHLQTRLQSIFTAIDQGTLEPCLYTKKGEKDPYLSLFLIFDNGIDPDPIYASSVRGRIFLDDQSNLCFTTSPLDSSIEALERKEILFPNVKTFEFEFLAAANEDRKNERRVNTNLAWKKSISSRHLPSIIRLKIEERQGSFLEFAFLLPTKDSITFAQKKRIA